MNSSRGKTTCAEGPLSFFLSSGYWTSVEMFLASLTITLIPKRKEKKEKKTFLKSDSVWDICASLSYSWRQISFFFWWLCHPYNILMTIVSFSLLIKTFKFKRARNFTTLSDVCKWTNVILAGKRDSRPHSARLLWVLAKKSYWRKQVFKCWKFYPAIAKGFNLLQ